MGHYELRNGKRCYVDDNGRVTVDNVSQSEADRRAGRNGVTPVRTTPIQTTPVRTTPVRATTPATPSRTAGASTVTNGNGNSSASVLISILIILGVIGAFLYNNYHTSYEEWFISNYMNETTEEGVREPETVSEYIMPGSDSRYLEQEELSDFTVSEIQLIINEIYARHGREFHGEEMSAYFGEKSWYAPISGKSDEEIVSEFNEYEKANIQLLCQYL